MRTINTRKKMGFPEKRGDWAKSQAVFDEHSLRIAGHPVMEDWELGYMNRLAEVACSNGGDVLEVGFGLGLSAKAIQSQKIKKHFVIECHPNVIAKCVTDFSEEVKSNKLEVLSGFWQDVTPSLKSETFDGILFDTYPLSEEEIHSNHFWFFEEAYRLLKPGGVLTYYSDEATNYSEKHIQKLKDAGFKIENINHEMCAVNPPADCEYWQAKTLLVPIIKK